jgi:hypothetical protein
MKKITVAKNIRLIIKKCNTTLILDIQKASKLQEKPSGNTGKKDESSSFGYVSTTIVSTA